MRDRSIMVLTIPGAHNRVGLYRRRLKGKKYPQRDLNPCFAIPNRASSAELDDGGVDIPTEPPSGYEPLGGLVLSCQHLFSYSVKGAFEPASITCFNELALCGIQQTAMNAGNGILIGEVPTAPFSLLR
jgi:hypothetical protein